MTLVFCEMLLSSGVLSTKGVGAGWVWSGLEVLVLGGTMGKMLHSVLLLLLKRVSIVSLLEERLYVTLVLKTICEGVRWCRDE